MGREPRLIDREGWVETDDNVRLFYSTVGDGRQVVLVMGGFYFEKELDPILPGRTFVLLHQRGRGRSERPDPSRAGIAYEAADLERVRASLGIGRWSLIGWSYAGAVTALHAIEHPEHVDRLVHMCSLAPDQSIYHERRSEMDEKRMSRIDPEGLTRLEEMDKKGVSASDPIRFAREYELITSVGQMADPASAGELRLDWCAYPNEWPDKEWPKAFLDSFYNWDERDRLRKLECPMLVVHGLEDLISLDEARDMSATVPNARLLTIERSGHYPHLERPDVFFPAVDTFLSGRWPDGAVEVSA